MNTFFLHRNLKPLAKWLRFFGYFAEVYEAINLNRVCAIAKKEKRVILTKSKKEHKFFEKSILIKSSNYLDQLKEISNLIKYDENRLFSRCSTCNRHLSEISKAKIKNLVPNLIFNNNNNFKICRRCGKVYWKGTHYSQIKEKLEILFKNRLH